MHTFSQELKSAREARGISIQEVSASTLINPKFIEAIEQGNFTVLPQAYVRAFIREYAQVVGLNPQETLRKYEEAITGVHHPLGGASATEDAGHEELATVAPVVVTEQHRKDPRVLITRLATGVIVVVAAALVVYQIFLRPEPAAPPETPFQSVVAENEQRARQAAAEPVRRAPQVVVPPVVRDSLTLRAAILDTVWMQIVIDQEPPRDYIFPPRTRALWKARERFRLTLGNAGGVEFTLNEKALGALGKRGAVIRDFDLTRSTLEQ